MTDELNGLLDAHHHAVLDDHENGNKGRADIARSAILACFDRRKSVEGGEDAFDFRAHLYRQREWSARTFGLGPRAAGVVDHIRKELGEIEADPTDLTEWIDVVILALDGAWRSGATPEQIIAALRAKHAKNEARQWPDWRTMPADKAIEHTRSDDAARTEGKGNG